jgi:branched-chain amino acid transport system permease protein
LSASGYLAGVLLPGDLQARSASLRIVGIGLVLALVLLLRPRGVLGERKVVSRHIRPADEA